MSGGLLRPVTRLSELDGSSTGGTAVPGRSCLKKEVRLLSKLEVTAMSTILSRKEP